jgi:imidazolonepropionase-like amidohydrolase
VLARRGMTPLQALRAATIVSAELIDAADLGRIAPEMNADIVGVAGDPLTAITVTQRVSLVMKNGSVHKRRRQPLVAVVRVERVCSRRRRRSRWARTRRR